MTKLAFKSGLIGALSLLFIGTGPALAVSQSAHPQDSTKKLDGTNLRACQNREKAINNILQKIANRGSRQIDVFNKIAERTEAFYQKSGKAVSNYDALVADVNSKKAAAQATVEAIKADSVKFKCDGTDPKGAAQLFKDDLKKEIAALKDYKTAVKNLIVAVKSVQGTTSSTETTQ